MSSTKRLQFAITIDAPVERVFELMIGPESFKQWTSAFTEGSYFEGSWAEGEQIRFLAPGGEGMVSQIAEHRPNEFISIRHLGYIVNGVDDTESESIRAWAPAYENYTFQPIGAGTRVIVDVDVTEEFEASMVESWPKALQQLKALCEGDAA